MECAHKRWLASIVAGDAVIVNGFSYPEATEVTATSKLYIYAVGRKFRRIDGCTVNTRRRGELPLCLYKPTDAVMEKIEAKNLAWEIVSQRSDVVEKVSIDMLRLFVAKLRKVCGYK